MRSTFIALIVLTAITCAGHSSNIDTVGLSIDGSLSDLDTLNTVYLNYSMNPANAPHSDSIQIITNYPNPFWASTSVSFTLPKADSVTVTIYDVQGVQVKLLFQGLLQTGEHRIAWNSKDDNDHEVNSGVYFYKITSSDSTITRKMVLLR